MPTHRLTSAPEADGSVVVPAYRSAQTIKRALMSIDNQTVKPRQYLSSMTDPMMEPSKELPDVEMKVGIPDNWLSNRVFETHDDIVALCCEDWNKLSDQPPKIISIGNRKWSNEF